MYHRFKIILMSFLLACFAFLTWAVKTQASVSAFDKNIARFIVPIRTNILTSFFLLLTHLGDPFGAGVLFSLFCIFFLILKSRRELYAFILTLGLVLFTTEIIKYLVMRPRPLSPFLSEFDPSFPSSHAGMATIFLLSILLLVVPLIKNNFRRYILSTTAWIIFPLLALSRIYLSIHWTTDVIAGILLGGICFIGIELTMHLHEQVYPLPKK